MSQFTPLISPVQEEPVPEVARGASWKAFFVETLQTIVLALVLFVGINAFTARIRVDGHSMEPSFHHNDYVIVWRLAYRVGEIERGDVVVFPYPNNPEEDYIKRVVGLPGDVVAIQEGQLLVNGVAVDEPYLAEPMWRNFPEVVVPDGSVFVMGDNRNDSSDSRRWGPLSIEDILGKAVFVYWPPGDIKLVPHIWPEASAGGSD
ncbi:MAG: signal peptidase I [Chloroflexi bacterium]|nr:signal peptidase I [Chloroflexota bacterium]